MNQVIKEHILDSRQRLQLVHGDITIENVEAIVNAANAHLKHGGGVAAAIANKGGPQIQDESDRWVFNHGPVRPETPAYTSGGKLFCRYVIHTVGPVWGEGDEEEKLMAAIRGALKLGDQLAVSSIAFPAVSTGIFGFPKERAAGIIFQPIQDHFNEESISTIEVIRLTLFDQETLDIFHMVWNSIFNPDEITE
jgi:O-acetyl-ADP-ribose deacetylase (regulator of RNase III)